MPFTVFVSYSHKDKKLREKLYSHLSMLRNAGKIADWYDGQIAPGDEWKQAILTNLHTAQIILLLISADFLASDFCYNIEMKQALERHERGEAVVIPIILRPVHWKDSPFSKLHVLPSGAKPVTEWHPRDKAFVDIAEGIDRAIEKLK